ncbi:MAG: LamG domain-containing protein, partial [Proteobacteria bacterium]|nr:LamG domain-containing protein [Pseudomonadota bacterium]
MTIGTKKKRLPIVGLLACLLLSISMSARADLVAEYTFDDSTATDSSGNELHGVVFTNAEAPAFIDDPERGMVLETNKSAVELANLPLTDTVTLSFWLKIPTQNRRTWIGGGFGQLRDDTDTGETDEFEVRAPGTQNVGKILSAQSPTGSHYDGNWHHTAMVIDGLAGTVTCYWDGGTLNGGVEGTWTKAINYGGSTNIVLGAANTGFSNAIDCMLDSVRIYDHAVPAEEIILLMEDKPRVGISLQYPTAGTLNVPADITLSWLTNPDDEDDLVRVDKYVVYLDDEETLTAPSLLEGKVIDVDELTTGSRQGSLDLAVEGITIEEDTEYFWRVDAYIFEPNEDMGGIYQFEEDPV